MILSIINKTNIFRSLINQSSLYCSMANSVISSNATELKIPSKQEVRPDRLFKKIRLEIRSHDVSVIDSYIEFTKLAADNLNFKFNGVDLISKKPSRTYMVERQICLRSAFVHKKHREQYEWRTYIKFANYINLTESTADTFLEYIERNLPEGCSMIVHKFEALKMFDHLQPPSLEQLSD